jgi:reactive intermediate/imine deaminase
MLKPHLSPFRQIGNFVFVSGQLPVGMDFAVVPGEIEEQTFQCLANIDAILAEVGIGLNHVIKTTVWLARTTDFVGFNESYTKVFKGKPPARSTVRADLMIDALVEIEAIAAIEL